MVLIAASLNVSLSLTLSMLIHERAVTTSYLPLRASAGDIVLFNGSLVHAGAGYIGEVHMRMHFYTSNTEHRRKWHVANKTELVQRNEQYINQILLSLATFLCFALRALPLTSCVCVYFVFGCMILYNPAFVETECQVLLQEFVLTSFTQSHPSP
jgi:hypothetical protein